MRSAAVVICLLAPSSLLPQAHRAIILGQVTDRTGALVPAAKVQVIQKDTNLRWNTATNESGNYEVPGLLPGVYRIEASHRGFRTAAIDEVTLTSARRAGINLVLELGDVAESVTVRAEQQLLDTVSADANTVIDQRKIADLPVGQGNTTYLFFFAPGADSAAGIARGTSVGNDVQPMQRAGTQTTRFNGSPAGTAEFTIDGAPNTQRGNAGVGGGAAFNPSPEMVQEVRVQTATFDASVGHTGGATIDIVLKSGTNSFHGTLSKYWRSKEWNANTWAGNRGGIPRSDFQYKLWGGSLGGPVLLHKLYNGRDRTFFFIGFEDWASLSPNPPGFVTVPRPAQLRGDFSDLLRLGAGYQLFDPDGAQLLANGRIQRTPFPGNLIPASRLNPVASKFSPLWPEPNAAGAADGQLNFTYLNEPYPRTLRATPIRIDHNLTRAQKLFGRVVVSPTRLPRSGVFTRPREDFEVWKIDAASHEAALGDVWTFSPGFIGDFRASVMRFRWDTIPIAPGTDYKTFGMENVTRLFDTIRAGPPDVNVTGYTAFSNPQGSQQVSEIRSAAAHFTRVIANHSFKFGADLRWYIDTRGRNERLSVSFNGTYTRGPLDNSPAQPLGAGLADFLLGRFNSAQINQPAKAANLSTFQSFYFQDDWKISPKLTINAGLRYEREGPATERFDRTLSGFDFAVENPIAAQARAGYAAIPNPPLALSQFQVRGGLLFAAAAGQPRTIYDANNRNFMPRAGMAYQVSPSMVLRAGYGIYFVPYGQRFIPGESAVPGYDTNTFSFASPDGIRFTRSLDNLFPDGLTPPVGNSLGLRTFLGQSVNIPALRRNPNGYNQRWQFSLQKRIASAYKLEARYVGNRTIRMPMQRNRNALPNLFLSASPERDQPRIDLLTTRVNNPFRGIDGVGGNLATATMVGYSELLTPYPAFVNINVQEPQGWTSYHALQVEFERQFSNGITFQTAYTWAKTIDGLGYLNPADPRPEKVISDVDRPHIWRLIALYELPFKRNRFVAGWQFQGISFIQSGYPISFSNVLFRGDIHEIASGPLGPDRMFNIDAGFERKSARQLQSNIRSFPSRLAGVRTDTQWNTDLSMIKSTRITERVSVQFRAEAYNVFNQHFVQGAIDTNPVGRTFGSTTAVSGPRTLQLGIKGIF